MIITTIATRLRRMDKIEGRVVQNVQPGHGPGLFEITFQEGAPTQVYNTEKLTVERDK